MCVFDLSDLNETHYSSAAFTTLSVAKIVERQWQINEWLCTIGGRSQWPCGLKRGPASACLLGLRVRIPPGDVCMSLVSVVRCQVGISASGWSLVQSGLTESDREASVGRRPRPTRGCGAMENKGSIGGVITDRGKPKDSEKNLSRCQFVHHKAHMR